MAQFESLDEAARGLLITTVDILNGCGLDYAVAGGWVPVLRAGPAGLVHPGTRDVDILLGDDEATVKTAAERLLEAGFHPSAKHAFQLLREARVGVRDFLFNIDLMHPKEASKSSDLFEDILDLGVNDAYDPSGKRWLKSIVFPSASIVFEQKLWRAEHVSGRSFDGNIAAVEVPLLTPAAFILSKCKSVSVEKRTRDAFDLYFVLMAPDADQTIRDLKTYCEAYAQVRAQVTHLRDWLVRAPENGKLSNATQFDENVNKYMPASLPDASRVMLGVIDQIL